jgi:hypothetical protein
MAYLLGINGLWKLAASYAQLALAQPLSEMKVPRHEGEYFLAICERLANDPVLPSHHRSAFRHLDLAEKLLKEAQPLTKGEDARYLAERAAHIFKWRLSGYSDKEGGPERLEKAIELTERAAALSPDDMLAQIAIYNNACYFFVHSSDVIASKTAENYYNALIHVLEKCEQDVGSWPPNVIDTVIWTRWKLRDRLGPLDLDQCITKLEAVMRSSDMPASEKKEIKGHLAEIRAYVA